MWAKKIDFRKRPTASGRIQKLPRVHKNAEAIAKNGLPAVEFEIAKRQVDAIGSLASSGNTKTIIVPTEAAGAIGALSSVLEVMNEKTRVKG